MPGDKPPENESVCAVIFAAPYDTRHGLQIKNASPEQVRAAAWILEDIANRMQAKANLTSGQKGIATLGDVN